MGCCRSCIRFICGRECETEEQWENGSTSTGPDPPEEMTPLEKHKAFRAAGGQPHKDFSPYTQNEAPPRAEPKYAKSSWMLGQIDRANQGGGGRGGGGGGGGGDGFSGSGWYPKYHQDNHLPRSQKYLNSGDIQGPISHRGMFENNPRPVTGR